MTDPRAGTTGVGADRFRPPPAVGVAWALLSVNVLGFYEKSDLIIPLPRPVAQVITMGGLAVAFLLALSVNRRVRVRPSAYLLLLTMLTLVSIASSMQLESGLGSLFRCFRLTLFVATLWLLSTWWRGDLTFVRYHVRTLCGILLTVLVGLVVSPGSAFSGPGGRLVGAIWPIPPPQVGLYCTIATGLTIMLWFSRTIDWRSVAVVVVPAITLLLLSQTRTALLGLVVSLSLAGLTAALTSARVRRSLAVAVGVGLVIALGFAQVVQNFLQRGQSADELADLTGRTRVWDQLLERERTLGEQIFGIGLTDKSFNGLAIDNTWLSIYNEQGWAGIAIVATILAVLLGTAALRPPSPQRACAVFLVLYCIVASYTEVGLGDASPYLLVLAVAASLLVRRTAPAGPVPRAPATREVST